MKWSLFPLIADSMPSQMALDAVLFERFKKTSNALPILRFFTPTEPCISVGYSLTGKVEKNFSELIKKNPNISRCKRITGGGCVLHKNDLMFSVFASYRAKELNAKLGSVKESYRQIHKAVSNVFFSAGLKTSLYGKGLPKGNDCFQYPVADDVAFNNHKVAGGAQKRSNGFLLHQESIVLPPEIKSDDFMSLMLKEFHNIFGADFEVFEMSDEIKNEAKEKVKEFVL